MKMTEEFNFIDPSQEGGFYLAHSALMEPLKTCPEGKAFSIAKNETGAAGEPISYRVLRDIADRYSVGKKAFVVIEHPNVFEVRRLTDCESISLFYKFLKKDEKSFDNDALEVIEKMSKEFKDQDIEHVLKYSQLDAPLAKRLHDEGVIPYSYLQRRTVAMAAFRKSDSGATEQLKKAIASLIEKGIIVELPDSATKSFYETSAKLYKVV